MYVRGPQVVPPLAKSMNDIPPCWRNVNSELQPLPIFILHEIVLQQKVAVHATSYCRLDEILDEALTISQLFGAAHK